MCKIHDKFHYFQTNFIRIKKIRIWVDNGPQHFRTNEMLGLCQDLSVNLETKIDLNYFVPYHGKCQCDQHFSQLSRIYNYHCSTNPNENCSTNEAYISIIQNGYKNGSGISINSDLEITQLQDFDYFVIFMI